MRHPPFYFNQLTILLALEITRSSACLKYVPDIDVDDHILFRWEREGATTKAWTRNMKQCLCGKGTTNIPSWNVLVRITENAVIKYCGGTLINSFLVMTAYSCLAPEVLTPLDIWGPHKAEVNPSHISVWLNVQHDPIDVTSEVPLSVDKVFTDTNYIVSKLVNGPVTNNVALLKLKNEINLEGVNGITPICLLPSPKTRNGFKVDVHGWVVSGSGDNCHKYSRNFANVLTQREDLLNSHFKCFIPQYPSPILNDLSACKTGPENGEVVADNNQLCISNHAMKFENNGWPLSIETKTASGDSISIQLGLSSWDDSKSHIGNDGAAHRFFTNVSNMLPFIKYYSNEVNAFWCKEPVDAAVNVAATHENHEITILWENLTSSQRILRNDDCVCGEHEEAVARIVGGTDANPHEFKWQALVRISGTLGNLDQKSSWLCGGSLINDRMILTAAHCVIQDLLVQANNPFPGVKPADVDVYLEAHQSHGDGKLVKVKSVFFHPSYIAGTKEHPKRFDWDVALLELVEPVIFNKDKLMPVCLPRSEEISSLEPVGSTGWVTGWGLTDPSISSSTADILQKIQLKIQPLEYCNNIVPVNEGKARDRVLCAGYLTSMRDAAAGDSGGPLSIPTGQNMSQLLQVGIVSYGHDVGDQTAAFYTDVRKVLSFIDFFSANARAEWCPLTRNVGTSI